MKSLLALASMPNSAYISLVFGFDSIARYLSDGNEAVIEKTESNNSNILNKFYNKEFFYLFQ